MKFNLLFFLPMVGLFACINAPSPHPPSGTFSVKSDCPGASTEGTVTAVVERVPDSLTENMTLSNAEEFGFPTDLVEVGTISKGQYTLKASADQRECFAYWDSSFSDDLTFICKDSDEIVCTISLTK